MTPTDEDTGGPHDRVPFKHVMAVFLGNGLEFYDFLTFSYFAVYIARTFYPGDSPTAGLLATLATFGAGFLNSPAACQLLPVVAVSLEFECRTFTSGCQRFPILASRWHSKWHSTPKGRRGCLKLWSREQPHRLMQQKPAGLLRIIHS